MQYRSLTRCCWQRVRCAHLCAHLTLLVPLSQVGVFEKKPERVAATIKRWLSGGGAELRQMAVRARTLGKPEALFDIVRDLATLVDTPSYHSQQQDAAAAPAAAPTPS